jgi:hypothetical protein
MAKNPKYLPDSKERMAYLLGIAKARKIFSNPPQIPTDARFTMQPPAADLDTILKGFGLNQRTGFDPSDVFGIGFGVGLGDDPRTRGAGEEG